MTFKLKFNKDEETCTGIIMYPSHRAHELVAHLNARGVRCRLHFRGEDQGCTVFLEQVSWRRAVEVFEEFLGRELPLDKRRRTPPESIRIPSSLSEE